MANTSLNHERLQEICGSLREQMFRKGTKGLKKVALVFRQADFNGNKKLDREEFEEALSHCGLFLKSHETSFLFKNFDRDGDGNINYDELLHGIQLPLSPPRLAMVTRAFKILDKDGSSVIDVNDIAKIYDASNHPDVQEGKKTEREVLIAFMGAFEKTGSKDGRITFDEFKSYYEVLRSVRIFCFESKCFFMRMSNGGNSTRVILCYICFLLCRIWVHRSQVTHTLLE